MDRLNRQITRKLTLDDLRDDYGYVDATPEERIGMVWDLTVEHYSKLGYDMSQPLQRHVTKVIRRKPREQK
ncbi:MAG: hypothetical protein FJY67_07665 [Calditrichaeota bacterium]|nr:hypothetical protein [Calditrichota bacterium]